MSTIVRVVLIGRELVQFQHEKPFDCVNHFFCKAQLLKQTCWNRNFGSVYMFIMLDILKRYGLYIVFLGSTSYVALSIIAMSKTKQCS